LRMSNNTSNKEVGRFVECLFQEKVKEQGLDIVKRKGWYDFVVEDEHRVEIKSCMLSNRNQGSRRLGRFNFHTRQILNRIKSNNVWVGFYVHHYDDALCLGFVEGRKLPAKVELTYHKTLDLPLLCFEDFLETMLYGE